MTSAIWLRNLEAYAVQAGVLVVAGAVLARVLRIAAPRAALAYWRGLLAACLLLPLCQPWQSAPPAPETPVAIQLAADRVGASPQPASLVTRSQPRLEQLAIAVLVTGLTARALWLVLGAWVLGRIRRTAARLEPLPDPIARAQARVGASAVFYVSGRIAGPVTFGVRPPAIVFPPGIAEMDPSIQYAIACHELLHVRRRDWLFQVIEESIRAAAWFHPAVWWLIGRIQLTREQVVDQEAAAMLESRERYVEALLAVAIAKSPRLLTPAPAFFRRSLLKKRVAQILQESTMTTGRLIVSLGASAGVLALAATMTVRAFPLQGQGQPAGAPDAPVQIVKGGEHLLHGEVPEYPRRAIENKVEGDVLLDLSVDDQGEVADARVLSGPDELRKATLETVLNWHYAPAAVRSSSIQATLRFNLAAAKTARRAGYATEFNGRVYISEAKEQHGELTRPQQLEHIIGELNRALEDEKVTGSQREEYKAKLEAATSEMAHINAERQAMEMAERTGGPGKPERYNGPLHLVAFETERVSRDAAAEVMQRAGLKIGDTITEQSLKNVRATASAVDEHFHVVMHDDGRGGISLVLVSRE